MDCKKVDCKKVKEELIFLFADNEMGQELLIAFRQHMNDCPHCAEEARYTRHFLTIVRQKVVRWPAPQRLRRRVMAILPHRRPER